MKIQYRMIRVIIKLYNDSMNALEKGVDIAGLVGLKVKEKIAKMKFTDEKDERKFDEIETEIEKEIELLIKNK
jgi:V/A-type H+-transporting ATPase subunit A